MTPGKLAAQAGHAFLDAYLAAADVRPEIAREYARLKPGTKVTLIAPCLDELERARMRAEAMGVPCAWIVDSGHVHPPHFDGSPVVTALGIGPATRSEVRRITGSFALAPWSLVRVPETCFSSPNAHRSEGSP